MPVETTSITLCVRSLLELNSIPSSKLYEGRRAWVIFENKEYRWHNSNWNEIIEAEKPDLLNVPFTNVNTITVNHNLGYIPSYFVYDETKDFVLCDVIECDDKVLKLSFLENISGNVAILGSAGHEFVQFVEPEELPDETAQKFTFVNSMGHVNSTANIIINSTLDGDPALVRFDSLTLNAGHVLTTSKRCKGLFVEVMGDCHIAGAIRMTARGPNCSGKFICIKPALGEIIFSDVVDFSGSGFPYIQKEGGAGGRTPGDGNINPRSAAGQNAIGYACGGGGEGGSRGNDGIKIRYGTAGTSFSGGSAGGGVTKSGNFLVMDTVAQPEAGLAGRGRNPSPSISGYGASGGAGNPGGVNSDGSKNSQDGTGGLIILIVHGNLTITAAGIIESNGSNGGAHNSTNISGGGGSGGGSVNVFHGGNFTNYGTVRALGGVGTGKGGSWGYGGHGGAGTVRIETF